MKPSLSIALALIWRGGEVLVARRASDADHLPDVWEFPGGKIEPGESLAQAAIREAREETGLEVEVVAARQTIDWDYGERRVSLHAFDCRVIGGETKAKFVAVGDLKVEEFPAANQSLIQELKNGNHPGDSG